MWDLGLGLGLGSVGLVVVVVVDAVDEESAVDGWRRAGLVMVVAGVVVVAAGGRVEDAAVVVDDMDGAGLDIPVTGLGACMESGLLEAARRRVWVVAVLIVVIVPGFAAVLIPAVLVVPVMAVAVPVVEIEDAEFCRL